MRLNQSIKKIFTSDFVLGLILLGLFMATNGYTYAWDDQHLEIPMLKGLIDPTLYPGDYYVQTLKANFPSLLYRILAKLITVDQIPAVYFGLYLFSRFMMFYFMNKLWSTILQNRLTGFICTLMSITAGRVEEFCYRTFSHQEFALGIIMAGIYYFYREQFFISALILGIAANFHSVYSLFPMLYMLIYLLFNVRRLGFRCWILTGVIFTVGLLPSLYLTIPKYFHMPGSEDPSKFADWIPLFHIVCPQNFLFYDHSLKEAFSNLEIFLETTKSYWIIVVFYILNLSFSSGFRRDGKIQASVVMAVVLLGITFVFTYISPHRFIVDLNLIRNFQYLQFFLMGYTSILIIEKVRGETSWLTLAGLMMAFALIRFKFYMATAAGLCLIGLLGLETAYRRPAIKFRPGIALGSLLILAGGLWIIGSHFPGAMYSETAKICLYIIIGLAVALYGLHFFIPQRWQGPSKWLFIIVPLIVLNINNVLYHVQRLKIEKSSGGFWEMQRSWIDMQNYVREHTPQQSLLLIPYDTEMGGFRIRSERSVVVCYRDCGLIGFDYLAAVEWQKRIKEIEPFKVFVEGDIMPAVMTAVTKYKVNYIVFMRYLHPLNNAVWEKIYENHVFSLYKIKPNPI